MVPEIKNLEVKEIIIIIVRNVSVSNWQTATYIPESARDGVDTHNMDFH